MGKSALDKLKLPGFVEDMNFRKFENYIKCPMRNHLFREGGMDIDLEYVTLLDLTFNKAGLMMLAGAPPTAQYISNTLLGHLKSLDTIPEVRQALYDRAMREAIPQFANLSVKLLEKYNVISPVTSYQYSNNGVSIEIVSCFTLQEKKGTEAFCVLLEYQKVYDWKCYTRLWSAVLRDLLSQRGLNRIGVKVLSLQNGDLMDVHPSKYSLTVETLHFMTAMFASRAVYPVYGGHCHRCGVSPQCGQAVS